MPVTTDEFLPKRFERPGRADFPGSIPPLSAAAEPALIYTLLTELSSKFKLELDSEPSLSRELTLSSNLPKASSDVPALFIGGSNADRLANAAANVAGHRHRRRLAPQHDLIYHCSSPDRGLLPHASSGGTSDYLLPGQFLILSGRW
jgi:hypothetical protein